MLATRTTTTTTSSQRRQMFVLARCAVITHVVSVFTFRSSRFLIARITHDVGGFMRHTNNMSVITRYYCLVYRSHSVFNRKRAQNVYDYIILDNELLIQLVFAWCISNRVAGDKCVAENYKYTPDSKCAVSVVQFSPLTRNYTYNLHVSHRSKT